MLLLAPTLTPPKSMFKCINIAEPLKPLGRRNERFLSNAINRLGGLGFNLGKTNRREENLPLPHTHVATLRLGSVRKGASYYSASECDVLVRQCSIV